MSIEIKNVNKQFGNFVALKDINLVAPTGELMALLGPSGSGKSTLLRIIAGLEIPDSGQILFHGEDAINKHVNERRVGFVFQHYALFKQMTVFENIAFGLRVKPRAVRPAEKEIRDKVHKVLSLVQLDWVADRYPAQLSGGQRQRIALARVLAVEPNVLLLDEPFGALDAQVRKELRAWLRRFHDELKITSIFVTHDQEEALEVADRIVVMNDGKIEQIGMPAAVYDNPANPFVYNFLGSVNIFHGRVHQGRAQICDLEIDAPEHCAAQNKPAAGYVRPHDIEIELTGGNNAIESTICAIRCIGPLVRLSLKRNDTGDSVEAELSKDRYAKLGIKAGDRVFIRPKNPRVFLKE